MNENFSTVSLNHMNQKLPQNQAGRFASWVPAGHGWMVIILTFLFLIAGSRKAAAFALNGPLQPWQASQNGSNPLAGDPILAGPHNIGEEFRRNTPVMYW